MKNVTRRIFVFALAMILAVAMAVPAFAQDLTVALSDEYDFEEELVLEEEPSEDAYVEAEEEVFEDDVYEDEVVLNEDAAYEDGVYAPDSFSFSGGSGKAEFTCPAFSVTTIEENGVKETTMFFLIKVDSSNYTTMTFNEEVYEPIKVVSGEYAAFSLPLVLNEANTVTAHTTAMGGKDIDYTFTPEAGEAPKKAELEEAVYGEGTEEDSNNIVASALGMTRVSDHGTSVTVKDDGTMDVTIAIKPLTRKYTGLYLGTIEEAEADSANIVASTNEGEVIGKSNKNEFVLKYEAEFKFNVPVTEVNEAMTASFKQITAMPDGEEGWFNRSGSTTTLTVQATVDLYKQLKEKAEAATGDAKEALESALDKCWDALSDEEKAETGEIAELEITNNNKMFKVNAASLARNELLVTMNSAAYDNLYVGHSEEAEEAAEEDLIMIDPETFQFTLPVEDTTEPILLSFHSKKNDEYYNRTFTIDAEAKTLVTGDYVEPVGEVETLSEDDAIAKADELATVEMVNSLIRAIKVQSRDENTDKYCKVARVYYDKLSDEEKEQLIDPGYFGDDTGDASKDDPLNTAPDKKKELLIVSFGTSFNDSRVATIKAVEDALADAFPEYAVRRAFTAQIIINHVQARDGEAINNMEQALELAANNGVTELVVQPTHLMHGAEYDEMCAALKEYESKIDSIIISEPLLNTNTDKIKVAKAAVEKAVAEAGFESAEAADTAKTAIVFMGHGTAHEANVTYNEMQKVISGLGYKNVFVGTVEGEPAETEVNTVLAKVQAAGYEKAVLRPLMVVAGDHANNDMAGDDADSWKSIFSEALGAENVDCQIKGLGELDEVQQLYVDHTDEAINGPKVIDLEVTNNNKMFKVASASLVGDELSVTMNSAAYDNLYVGHSEEAEDAAEEDLIMIDPETFQFTLPVEDATEPILLAFHSKNKDEYYNRTFEIDVLAKTLVTGDYVEPVGEVETLSEEEALAKADELATVEMVNSLIRAIKVQSRDENTDKYCKVAKAYYDKLTDEEKEQLIDPEYFGNDTGDASLDDPRNQDEIGDKELLVVSFGTSFNGSRVATVKAVEDALADAYPDYSVRRAFTAQIIINHVQSRDGEAMDNMEQALDRAVANGVKELVVQPTHLMHGYEYDEMCAALDSYKDKFDSIIISEPLLNSDEDKEIVAEAAVEEAVKDAGAKSLEELDTAKTAIVFMGHGTSHDANQTYNEMQALFTSLGDKNVFVGTVEGEPEETEVNTVLKAVQDAGYTKVILRPLMVVAGDHANNDMAGDEEDSWKSIFGAALGAENVDCQINGLGEIEDVQQLYVQHVKDAITPEAKITGIKLNKSTLTIATKDTLTLVATVTVENQDATVDKTAVWSSSDPESVAVDQSGKITVLKVPNGIIPTVTITAQAKADPSQKATCVVTPRFYDVNGTNDKTDKANYQYYYDPVYWAATNEITKGYGDKVAGIDVADSVYFGPSKNCQRREMMIFLWRIAGAPTKDKNGKAYGDARTMFKDLGKYGADTATNKAIAWGYKEGIVKGYNTKNGVQFRPTNSIVRKDTMIMLYRLAGKPSVSGKTKFKDVEGKFKTSSDTYKAILWGSRNGITNGYTTGTYAGQFGCGLDCLREHIVTFLYRAKSFLK